MHGKLVCDRAFDHFLMEINRPVERKVFCADLTIVRLRGWISSFGTHQNCCRSRVVVVVSERGGDSFLSKHPCENFFNDRCLEAHVALTEWINVRREQRLEGSPGCIRQANSAS